MGSSLAKVAYVAPIVTLALATPARALDDKNEPIDGEIIVTGQKLSQSLQDTPASVVVATSDAVGQPAFRTVEDYLRGMPNVVFSSNGQAPTVRGIDGNGVALRGTGAVSGGRPRLTTYVDDVPRSFSFLPNGVPVTWDIAQLELYRGAQSTSLGRNAIAGALVVQTAEPEDRLGGAAQIGIRSRDTSYDGAVTLNMPLVSDRLALRVSADGYTGDTFMRYGGPLAAREDFLSRDDGYRVRAKLLYRPRGFGDALSFRIAYERQYARRSNPQYYVDLATAGDFTLSDPSSGGVYELRNDLVSFETKVPLGDDWLFSGIASYQFSRENSLPVFGDGSSIDVFANSKEYTQEARLTYAPQGTQLQAVVGIFHFDRNRTEGGVPGSAFVYDATDKGSTLALFADTVIPIGPFDLLVGGRIEQERQKRDFLAVFGLGLNVDIRQDVVLPKAGLRWNLGPRQTLTASYYRGYSPAAAAVSFTSFTPYRFAREVADNVELAWRSTFGLVTVNANIFGSWYRRQQLFGSGPLGAADVIVINADRTRYIGAEADVTWTPSPAFRATASLGLLDTKIVRFGGNIANAAANGNELPHSPPITARLALSWKPVERLRFDGDARYAARQYSTYDNTVSDRVGDQSLIDLRAGYDLGRVSLHVYMENVFDRFYFTAKDPDFRLANVGRPRTFGAALRTSF